MFSQTENEWFDREVEAEIVDAPAGSRRTARKASALARAAFVALCLVALAIVLLGSRPAQAEELQARTIGVGYKIGNGMGFEGGDVVLRLIPHVVFDLQANHLAAAEMTGYGLAPTVQLQLKEVGHTPYVSAGLQYASLSSASRGATVTGFVVNAGYEWRFASGVGVLVGGGVQDIVSVKITTGTATGTQPPGPDINLEAGVRYFF